MRGFFFSFFFFLPFIFYTKKKELVSAATNNFTKSTYHPVYKEDRLLINNKDTGKREIKWHWPIRRKTCSSLKLKE